MAGAVGVTTPTDPRSQRNRAGRRGGQLLTRVRNSSYESACPPRVLPVPLVPDGRTIRQDRGGSQPDEPAPPIFIPVTNAIESLNAKLRRAVRTRGHFPTDESAMKLLYLVLNLASKEWKMPPCEWGMARAQLAILFEDRFRLA
jgi:putative transposase